MPLNAERTPRKRPENNSNRRGQASERKRSLRATASDRERAPRAKTSDRERSPRAASRARTPERQRDSARTRARTPERQRTRTTSPARTSERRRARNPAPVRRRASRRRSDRPSVFSRAAVAAVLILFVSFLGNRFFFHGLQVIGRDAPPVETSIGNVTNGPTIVKSDAPDDGDVKPDDSGKIFGAAPDTDAQQNRKSGFYNILLLGTDNDNGGSDTIILMSVDSQNHRIFGLSVPRDTKAVIDGRAYKINAAYKIGGSEQLAETLSYQLGVPIDYTVEVNLEAFAALIDALGGVDFDVPINMDYEDPAQNLTIKVSQGLQHLDGATALKVVRFRHNSDGTGYPDEDLGRIRTQQNFLKTAAKKMFSFSTLTKLDDFVRIFKKYVKTDLTLTNLAWLAREAIAVGTDHLHFATLPGEWKNPYIYPDPQKTLSFVNEYLNPYETDRALSDLHLPQ